MQLYVDVFFFPSLNCVVSFCSPTKHIYKKRLQKTDFKIAGWNQWEVVEAAAGAPSLSGASIPPGLTGPQLVRVLLRRGAALGFNTMRTWAHAVNAQYTLQTKPGVFSEPVFQGLDYLLDEARSSGVKLILAFTSYWTPTGGVPEYLKWGGSTKTTDFYTNPAIIEMYQNFVRTILLRRNTINGRLYRDDPTVMAWDLLNEPRCPDCPAGTVAKWFAQQAAFVRSIDPNHLITTGEEGFYGCCGNTANPGVKWSEWASSEGQDFLKDHGAKEIDFGTIHSWPDNWQDVSEEFQREWVSQHVKDAGSVLKKPVILEEWGKWVNLTANATIADRTRFMSIVFDEVKALMSQPNSPLQGSLFWQWYLEGQEGAPTEGGGRGLFGIYETDEAFSLIKDNIAFITSLNKPISGCAPAAHRAANVSTTDICQSTWVRGLPGTGFEGPGCKAPINECVRGTHDCDTKNAACIDTSLAFECRCYFGFLGNGHTCTPDPSTLPALKSVYWSEPKGLSCKPGIPVEYPQYAPGWVYDPMNSFAFWDVSGGGKLGSKANVTLEKCFIACQMAPTCESVVYNDVLQQCFLARGQCPVYNYCQGEQAKCKSTNDRGGQFEFGCGYWVSYYRLDSAAGVNCEGFTPDPSSVGQPSPQALDAWSAWSSAHPGAQLRYTPPGLLANSSTAAVPSVQASSATSP